MKLTSIVIIFLILNFVNCGNRNRFLFIPSRNVTIDTKIAKTISIETFKDLREPEIDNYRLFIFIPLFFYETEESTKDHFNSFTYDKPGTVIPLTLRKEIQSYKHFLDVYVQSESDLNDADYIIQGKLLKTEFLRSQTAYGLSVLGICAWIFGLPMTYTEIDLEFEISLLERKSNRIILIKRYTATKTEIQNLYQRDFLINANSLLDKIIKSFAKDCVDVLSK
jgi:hypothetical protein